MSVGMPVASSIGTGSPVAGSRMASVLMVGSFPVTGVDDRRLRLQLPHPRPVYLTPSVSLSRQTVLGASEPPAEHPPAAPDPGRVTARRLADELEVSVRTIYRDLDALAWPGCRSTPSRAVRRRPARRRLPHPPHRPHRRRGRGRLPHRPARPGRRARPRHGAGHRPAEGARGPPPELRAGPPACASASTSTRPAGSTDPEPNPPFLGAVADAVWEQRVLQVHYRSWRGEVDRRVEPLGLVLKAGTWYVVGLSAARTGRIGCPGCSTSRCSTSSSTGRRTSTCRRTGRRTRPGSRPASSDDEATVRLSPVAWERFGHWWSPRTVAAMRASAAEPDEEGWRRVVIPLESMNHARTELLRLGGEVEVLDPPELRQLLIDSVPPSPPSTPPTSDPPKLTSRHRIRASALHRTEGAGGTPRNSWSDPRDRLLWSAA